MRADNSTRLRAAATQRAELTRQRADTALAQLRTARRALSVAEFCRHAGVSRAWLYTQPELLAHIRAASANAPGRDKRPPQHASAASLLRRLQLAQQRITRLTAENRALRDELATAYGQLRDTRADPGTAATGIARTNPAHTGRPTRKAQP